MNRTLSERAVILAPRGRDASVAAAMLREAAIGAEAAADIPALAAALREGAGFAAITEEALRDADLRPLTQFLEAQEEWSDFPFILLTERGGGLERNPMAVRFLENLGNVTFLERPFHPTTLVSLARAALRGRRRQYDARARLEAIHEGQEKLKLALAAGRLGAWTLDVREGALDASAACKGHFGRGPDELFDYATLVDSIHPDDRAMMQAAVTESIVTGRDYDVEYRTVWPDGSAHWVLVRGRPELDEAGQTIRMAGVSQDITERRAAEEALKSFAIELEQRVEERTHEREVAVAQLHEAQKLETLGQLTGGVAHDFNNLLTPMVGGLDLLKRMHSDERSQRLIGGALQASERASTLVARLLAFARRQTLEARPVDIVGLVNGMADLIRRSIGPRIMLGLDLPVGLPAALVDANQLELALLNLAVNARDAMPEGGGLTIAVRRETVGTGHARLGEGDYIVLSVTDSGTGMDADTLLRAIEPFYSTKGVGKGTGLGLSMVHGLAAQSGGALDLQSEVGTGTSAVLWLPVAIEAAAVAVAAPEAAEAQDSLRVLVVDDEDLVRQGTIEMLTDLGHRVADAPSGAAALKLLRSGDYDLMITDYLMPGMSGIELAQSARRTSPGLPILMISGFADLAEGVAIDVVRLAKPYRQSELAGAILRAIDSETVASSVSPA